MPTPNDESTKNSQGDATEKKVVDVIGSVDDYGAEPFAADPMTRTKDTKKWEGPRIVDADPKVVMSGLTQEPIKAIKSFIVGENRWGDKKVWAVRPYCSFCSPAAPRDNDIETVASFDEYGAERTMSRRESRLTGLTPSQHFSFTLVETADGIRCHVCKRSPHENNANDESLHAPVVQKDVEFEPAFFDPAKPMLGIKVDEGLFRIPEGIVSHWIETDFCEKHPIHIARKGLLYSIGQEAFMKHSIYDEGNKQWLLNPEYCDMKDALEGIIKHQSIWVDNQSIQSWRATALPMDTMIMAEGDGAHWAVSQGKFLQQGESKSNGWAIPLEKCDGPLVGVKDC